MSRYEIEVRTISPQPVAFLRKRVTWSELGQAFMEMLPTVGNALKEIGAKGVTAPFGRYANGDQSGVDLEAGIGVASSVELSGEVEKGELPGGEVAFTVHNGPYDQLGEAHKALFAWSESHERTPSGPVWEMYITDPEEEPDPSKWRTELYLPLT